MAEKYQEDEYELEDQHDDTMGIPMDSYSGGSGFSIWKILLGVGVVAGLTYQFFHIEKLSSQLKTANLELSGTSQSLSEQKNKLSNKSQLLSDLESKVSKYEADIADYKRKLADAQSQVSSLNDQATSQGSGKEAEVKAANEKVKTLEDSINDLNTQVTLLKVDDLRVVTLKGAKKFPTGFGKMLWSQKQGAIYLNIINLSKTPDGKEFQLSANEGDHFFKVGTFTMGDTKTAWIKIPIVDLLAKKKISDFVVTLEKKGGSDKITRPFFLSGSLGP